MADPSAVRRSLRAVRSAGLVRPPSLTTDDERTASRLELFFDLAFVLVVAELAGALREDVSAQSVAVFAGLFATVWWAWVSSTLYANRFDHDDVVFRLYKLASMAAVIGLAATASEATGERPALFAGCQVLLRVVLLLQYARVHRHVAQARPLARTYLLAFTVGGLLWAVSMAVPAPVCFVLWGLAVAVEVLAPLRATAASSDVPLHMEHLPERFALFVILVLGESVAAVAHGLYEAHWTAEAVAVGAVSFVLAAALWWSHFDLAGAGAKRLLAEAGGDRSERAHDVYVFGQLPIALALAGVGAGIQLAVLESGQGDVPLGTRVLLAGGVALYLAAVSVRNSGMATGGSHGWWWPVLAAALAALDLALDLPAVVVVGALTALLVAVIVVGTVQRATGDLEVDPV
ncbi:low temperature requirement protein A [Modestobacter altitudinis]|uniref:low temperature requirement protein A n=1 Tax=Modestobacter altitudinis TaxID=2213158 RepID=UPI00110CA908|nr:low temperature requirement protein A [Modestobacter altitudinis]